MSEKTCRMARKPRYSSKKEAEKAIFDTRLRSFATGGRAGQGRVVKRCEHCHGFHVGMPS